MYLVRAFIRAIFLDLRLVVFFQNGLALKSQAGHKSGLKLQCKAPHLPTISTASKTHTMASLSRKLPDKGTKRMRSTPTKNNSELRDHFAHTAYVSLRLRLRIFDILKLAGIARHVILTEIEPLGGQWPRDGGG